MMMVLMIGSAFAAEPKMELNVSRSSLGGVEKSLSTIGAENVSSAGIEFGYTFLPWLSVVSSWEYGGVVTQYGDYDAYYDDYGQLIESDSIQGRFDYHQINLGTRFQHQFIPRLQGYAKSEAALGLGGMRFAQDLEEEDPLSQGEGSALSVGGVVSLGLMYRSKPLRQRIQFQANVEVGYAILSELSFSNNIGAIQLDGLHSSFGVGVRF